MPSLNCSLVKVVLCLFLLTCVASPFFAETITLRPVADTSLFEVDPTNNLGGELTVTAGRSDAGFNEGQVAVNRSLLKFDLAGVIPTNTSITSVTLTLTVTNAAEPSYPGHPARGRVDSMFSLRRMLRAWGEGNKRSLAAPFDGDPATLGEATWLHRFFPDALWSTAGVGGGADAASVISATNFIRALGTYAFTSTPNLVADVQFWQTNSAANFGWLLRSEDEGTIYTNRRFASREDTNNAPRLVIEYTLPGLRLDRISRSGTNVQLQFTAEAGKAYAIEFRAALNPGTWLTLTNISPPGAATSVTIPDAIAANARYYRLRSP